jgi:hypothetical protein
MCVKELSRAHVNTNDFDRIAILTWRIMKGRKFAVLGMYMNLF